MNTPFDDAVAAIRHAGYHNHRLENHSDAISRGLLRDLEARCEALRDDLQQGRVKAWLNVGSPGDRARKVDLFVGEPTAAGELNIGRVRIALENKSVITAHRNRTNRFDDLTKVLGALHAARPEAIILGTVLIGLCSRVLNVPDGVKPRYVLRTPGGRPRGMDPAFDRDVVPRLSSGDASLWTDFPTAISYNRPNDPATTLRLLNTIPTRKAGHTHVQGFDALLGVPVIIDNVNPPALPRPNALGIDVDAEYERMLDQICAAYTTRWHL